MEISAARVIRIENLKRILSCIYKSAKVFSLATFQRRKIMPVTDCRLFLGLASENIFFS
jgi:hypothetical protein